MCDPVAGRTGELVSLARARFDLKQTTSSYSQPYPISTGFTISWYLSPYPLCLITLGTYLGIQSDEKMMQQVFKCVSEAQAIAIS